MLDRFCSSPESESTTSSKKKKKKKKKKEKQKKEMLISERRFSSSSEDEFFTMVTTGEKSKKEIVENKDLSSNSITTAQKEISTTILTKSNVVSSSSTKTNSEIKITPSSAINPQQIKGVQNSNSTQRSQLSSFAKKKLTNIFKNKKIKKSPSFFPQIKTNKFSPLSISSLSPQIKKNETKKVATTTATINGENKKLDVNLMFPKITEEKEEGRKNVFSDDSDEALSDEETVPNGKDIASSTVPCGSKKAVLKSAIKGAGFSTSCCCTF